MNIKVILLNHLLVAIIEIAVLSHTQAQHFETLHHWWGNTARADNRYSINTDSINRVPYTSLACLSPAYSFLDDL